MCGTTGESPTLSNHEKLALLEAMVEVAHARGAPVIAGTTTYNTAESVELSREARTSASTASWARCRTTTIRPRKGCSSTSARSPGAVDLPVILYNIPARSPRNMEASTTLRLAREVPNIVGVKEASGNFKQIGEIIRDAPDGFRRLERQRRRHPDDHGAGRLRRGVGRGASGRPADRRADARPSSTGDNARAAEIHHRLMPLVDALFVTSSPIPLKYALEQDRHARRANRVCRSCRSIRRARRSWTPRWRARASTWTPAYRRKLRCRWLRFHERLVIC